jgi:hypothetical protein
VASAWGTVGVLDAGPAPLPAPPVAAAPTTGTALTTARVVVVGRSGGVTGMSTERRMNLGSLPAQQAGQWQDLLTSGVLQALEPARPRPDGFVYRVRCPGASLDITAAETELPDDVRSMIDDALRRDG